jgi:hypothetical protein
MFYRIEEAKGLSFFRKREGLHMWPDKKSIEYFLHVNITSF